MPYPTLASLPDRFDDLPRNLRERIRKGMNSIIAQRKYGERTEEVAHRWANKTASNWRRAHGGKHK